VTATSTSGRSATCHRRPQADRQHPTGRSAPYPPAVEREQPPVTVVDPSAPSGPAPGPVRLPDVAAGIWRRWPAQVVAVGVTVALAGGVLGALHVHQRERELDAAARQDVALAVSPVLGDWPGDDALTVSLLNLGRRPVRVLSIGLLPGSPVADVGLVLATGGALSLVVPDERACPEGLGLAAPTTFVVRVETARGDVVSRQVRLAPATDSELQLLEADRCGFVSPEIAVSVAAAGARHAGGVLTVRVRLRNASRLSMSLFDIAGGDGLAVQPSAALPLTLPAPSDSPARGVGTPTLTVLELRITVHDCRLLRSAVRGFGSTSVLFNVRNELGDGAAVLELLDRPLRPYLEQLGASCGS